jgi:hypothetical protein
VELPQFASLVHGLHVCVEPSQTGVVPEQSALATQRTQLPVGV